ncbi:MAG: hypothetical protein ABEN55_01340 [Bradymonadaceae bacterium]
MPHGRVSLGWSVAAGLLVVGLITGGCGDQNKQAADKDTEKAKENDLPDSVYAKRKREGELDREGKKVQSVDLNQDGRPDQWKIHSESGNRLWIARDMNFDGQVDVWQYPDDAGEVVEEEMDLDMDGTVDLVTYYKNAKIRRKELSVNFDEKFSIVKFYNKEGKLLRVERDEDRDGTTDVWEYYDDKGNRERVGWDENGDGVPDTFDKMP